MAFACLIQFPMILWGQFQALILGTSVITKMLLRLGERGSHEESDKIIFKLPISPKGMDAFFYKYLW